MAISYSHATSEDIPVLLRLEQCVVEAERPYNKNIKVVGAKYYDLERLILSDDAFVLIAKDNEVIIGTGYVKIMKSKASLDHESHGYLGFMYVDPFYRGQGINQTITQKLIAWAKSRGLNDFYLDVYSENQAAINAYEKSGFIPNLLEMKLNT